MADVTSATCCGYMGRILRVDLSTGEITVERPDARFYRTYVGGWGFVAYYLLKETAPGVDALGPDNLLVFAGGPVTGAPVAGGGRSVVGAKSPLTGGFGAAEAGGWFGAELRQAGFDAVVIRGRAERPVYLWIKDGRAELRPAERLWGMLTADAEAAIRAELGDERVRVAQIGPAGEQLSRIACVMHDVNRAAGRAGLGAVMGAKQLKAVAVRGTGRVPLADGEALASVARWFARHYRQGWGKDLQDKGTANGVEYLQATGGLPTRNFQEGTFAGAAAITGERMRDTILKDRDSCYACPVRCKRVVQVAWGSYRADPVYGGPEYETIGALGSSCGVDDLAAIAHGNALCNAYGLDTISCGVAIAWAMECFERGLLTAADTGGLELRFGDAEAMLHLVEAMGRREGFGRLLGEGAYRAAQTVGRGSEAFVMHVKGQEIPMHEPRIKFTLGLGYAVSPTGADHNHNLHDTAYTNEGGIASVRPLGVLEPLPATTLGPAKARLARAAIPMKTLVNCLGFCGFVDTMFDAEHRLQMVRAITGWDTSLYELHQAGERAYALARAYNAREGFTAADDCIPARFFEAFRDGPSAGNALPKDEFEQTRALFYGMMGWDEQTGAPTAARLHELGVGWVVEAMQSG